MSWVAEVALQKGHLLLLQCSRATDFNEWIGLTQIAISTFQDSEFMIADINCSPLEDTVMRVAPLVRQQSLQIPRQASRAISNNSQWRGWNQREAHQEPEWQDGLCGISLLPLDHLEELHIVPWVEDRPCLVSELVISSYFQHKTSASKLQKTCPTFIICDG